MEEILRQLNACGVSHDSSYYRTSGGAEVDLVLEGDFGRIAVEIKHPSVVNPRDLRTLREFVTDQSARLGVVITNDCAVRHLDDRIVAVPFQFL